MLWYGSIATIPSGWHLCDGTMGTPNLKSKFVMGAWVVTPPGSTGGASAHNHSFSGDGHSHDLVSGPDIAAGSDIWNVTADDSAVGTTDPTSNLPPFHALCYIMKL